MNPQLYEKLFARLEELGAIRKEECYDECDNPIDIPFLPILSDCILGIIRRESCDYTYSEVGEFSTQHWYCHQPYLKDQTDEVGKKLFELLS